MYYLLTTINKNMKLHALFEATFSQVNWESRGIPVDSPDYFVGGWVDSQTGHFINQHTHDVNHHIEFVLVHPEEFGLTKNDIPEQFRDDSNFWDAGVEMWEEYENFLDTIVAKGRWVRLYIQPHQEINLNGTKDAIKTLFRNGLMHRMVKKFQPKMLVVDSLQPKEALTFNLEQDRIYINDWLRD